MLETEFAHAMEIPDPIAHMEGKGITVASLSEESRAAFRKIVQPVYDEWIPRIGEDLYEEALKDMARR